MTAITAPDSLIVHGRNGLEEIRPRRRDVLLARLRADSLDARLATGEAPESHVLLAIRAARLTSPAHRRLLARGWDELATRAAERRRAFDPRVPVVHAAADQLRLVADVLRSGRPVSAHGVAAARLLLTDGRSPVYDVRRGAEDVAAAVVRAIERL